MTTELLSPAAAFPIVVRLSPAMEMTEASFFEFCQINRDLHIERNANGDLLIMSPTGSATGNRNLGLSAQLWNWATKDGSGLAFDSSAGFTLPNGAVRSPDVSWLKLEKWESLTQLEQEKFAPICPDFVVELRSPSDDLKVLQAKMQEYLDNGALLAWLIDRQHQQIFVYRPDFPVDCLENPAVINGDPLLSGFSLDLAKVW